ncbi:hypothetical protein [Nocardia sp. NPDC051463]|uniref:hypothetical protein n=1 Tax=Nocardia sp. NPDC051463 TaxID=3154845 RepID=UPI00344C67BF
MTMPADFERAMDRCDEVANRMDIERAHGIKVIHGHKKTPRCTPDDCPRLRGALEFIALAEGRR